MSIHSLPTELVLRIGDYMDQKDISHLAETNHSFHEILTPMLNKYALKIEFRTTAFYWAAITGNRGLLRFIIEKATGFKVKMENTHQAKSAIIMRRNTKGANTDAFIDQVVQEGIKLIVQRKDLASRCSTPLHQAAGEKRNHMLSLLLDLGAATEVHDGGGGTALHHAVSSHNMPAVQLLLSHGAKPNAQDTTGQTPLHIAAWKASREIAEVLLASGADVALKDNTGNSPIDITRFNLYHTLLDQRFPIEMLLAKAGKSFRSNNYGETVLQLAVRYAGRDFVKTLLKQLSSAEINAQDTRGWTALHWAAKWPSNEKKIQLLLDGGADAGIRSYNGETAVDIAARDGEMRASLLERADAGFRTKNGGQTPLHLAAKMGSPELTEFFIKKGVGAAVKDKDGKTAVEYALVYTFCSYGEHGGMRAQAVLRMLSDYGLL